MKKTMRSVATTLLILVLCLPLFTMSALAAGNNINLELPVKVTLSGVVPTSPETYTIKITADNASNPMPEGALDGSYSMAVQGAGAFKFPAMTYTKVGNYSYTVLQEKGTNALGHYDNTIYYVMVYVRNSVDAVGDLEETVCVYKDEEMQGAKVEIEFHNSYDDPIIPTTLTVLKTWVDDGVNRPDSVTVQLLDGDTVVDTVILSSQNDWVYKWTDLDASHNWQVKEIDIPFEYEATYHYAGDVVIIRNTGFLFQTGQLKWPIPVLTGLGLLLVAIGVTLHIRKRKISNA